MLGLNAMDRLFLIQYESLRTVGVYAVGYSLGYLGVQLLINPVWIMFPGAVAELHNGGDDAGVKRLFGQSVGAALLLGVPAVVGSAILGRQIVTAVAPGQFADAAPVISIVMAGYLLHMLASYCEVRLYLVQRQSVSTLSTVLALGVNVILNIVLIPRWSITGAAVATLVAFAVQLGVAWTVAHRAGVVETPVQMMLRVGVAAGAMAGALLGLQRMLEGLSARTALPFLILGGFAVYVLALLCLGGRQLVRLGLGAVRV
jgi:O-antigen/teichoic acid export membrane protein